MKEFWALFKYEFKMHTPFIRRGDKKDWLGFILGILAMGFVAAVCVIFLTRILSNYCSVEYNYEHAPLDRAIEMLNVLYVAVFVVLVFIFLERARKIFVDDKNKIAFMRLPVSQRNMFLSKFLILTSHMYFTCTAFVLCINIAASLALSVGVSFWIATFVICLFMPLTCLLFVALLIVPYIKIVELFAQKYTVMLILFTGALVGVFVLYSLLLSVIQTLLTTGSIRFLFNEGFIEGLQSVHKYSYPVNAYLTMLIKGGLWHDWLLIVLSALVSLVIMFVVSAKLYQITRYRQHARDIFVKKPKIVGQRSSFFALIKKEFICVYRQPKHLFTYLSVALSMPIMVYCCFTLFETLMYNALGIRISFALALSIVLLFNVLTNTFCATNVSRDGLGILKMKTLPIKTGKLFFAKVTFCVIINSFAVIVSCVLLMALAGLQVGEGFLCMLLGCAFTLAQVLVATRLDINYAKISRSSLEIEKQSTKTLSKVILIGATLALVASCSVILFAMLSSGIGLSSNVDLFRAFMYVVPVLVGIIYVVCAIVYYRVKLFRSFEKLSGV